jgi:hypothetical protein
MTLSQRYEAAALLCRNHRPISRSLRRGAPDHGDGREGFIRCANRSSRRTAAALQFLHKRAAIQRTAAGRSIGKEPRDAIPIHVVSRWFARIGNDLADSGSRAFWIYPRNDAVALRDAKPATASNYRVIFHLLQRICGSPVSRVWPQIDTCFRPMRTPPPHDPSNGES